MLAFVQKEIPQALRLGDRLGQKDQAVQTRCQCPNAIAKLIGAIFKPSYPSALSR